MIFSPVTSTFNSNQYIQDKNFDSHFGHDTMFSQEKYNNQYLFSYSSDQALKEHDSISSIFLPCDYASIYNYTNNYTENQHDLTANSIFNCDYMFNLCEPSVQLNTPSARTGQYYNNNNAGYALYCNSIDNFQIENTIASTTIAPGSPISTITDLSSPESFFPTSPSLLSADTNNFTKIDTKNKPKKVHPCQYCTRKFARKYDVNRHSRIHTGNKPYNCFCCHKSFARSDALNRHMRKEPFCFAFSERHGLPKRTKQLKD